MAELRAHSSTRVLKEIEGFAKFFLSQNGKAAKFFRFPELGIANDFGVDQDHALREGRVGRFAGANSCPIKSDHPIT